MSVSGFNKPSAGVSGNGNIVFQATSAGEYTVSIPAGYYKNSQNYDFIWSTEPEIDSWNERNYPPITTATPAFPFTTTKTSLYVSAPFQTEVSWTSRATGWGSTTMRAAAYGNDLFVVGGDGGKISTSTDGITWTTRSSALSTGNSRVEAVVYGNGLFIAAHSSWLVTSTDGATWSAALNLPLGTAAGTYGNGVYVLGGQSGGIRTSTDGVTWVTRTSNTSSNITGMTFGNGVYVAVANTGTIRTSTDGITWTTRSSSTTASFQCVTYGNGLFVASTNSTTGGALRVSADGITWTTATISSELAAINYGDGMFFGGKGTNNIFTSLDGLTWTKISNSTVAPEGIAYGNGTTILAGSGGVNSTTRDASFEREMVLEYVAPITSL